ncbi:MAG TPA: Fe-S cluster assembly protein SufD [Gemmataceae bacterium]|nr:Fe-S cluster assembly protein SufD [Gemmataceae bacterium]
MIEVQEEKNIYQSNFARFEKELGANGHSGIHRVRKAAMKRFSELGFPTTRNEEWKFTSVAPIAKLPFKPVSGRDSHKLSREQLDRASLRIENCSRLVFVDGLYAPELSSSRPLPAGVILTSLAAVLNAHPEWAEPHLARHARYQEHAFTALNTGFIRDGAFLSVAKGVVVEEPIELLFVATAAEEGSVAHPRNLIVAGANSQVTVVESYLGLNQEVYFTNGVTEIVAAENSVIDHYKIQRESREAFHVATMQVQQGQRSKFSSQFICLGGALVRNEVNVTLDAEGCECTLNGLYLASGQQHIDNHTLIDHAKPRCTSHELYKGILDGKAHGVFNGKIFVRQDAQKTDAKQTNQTLLLSDNAVINTKPQLEIYADDVKCTHGATIGQLQEEAIFYLRSRGIGLEEARSLLTFAFANDIISRIKVEPIRVQLEKLLLQTQHLPRTKLAGEAS